MHRIVLLLFVIPALGMITLRSHAQEPTSAVSSSQPYHLQNVVRLTAHEDFVAPTWSPTNQDQIALSRRGFRGLFLLSITTREIRELVNERSAGFGYVWTADGEHIVYRANVGDLKTAIDGVAIRTGQVTRLSEARSLGLPAVTAPGVVSYRSTDRTDTRAIVPRAVPPTPGPFAYQENDQIFISRAGETIQITSGEGKHYLPRLSPDLKHVVYEEIATGIYVTNIDNRQTFSLGRGNNARWSSDSGLIVFDVSDDDGHVIVASDLFVSRSDGSMRTRLTDTPDRIERRPTFSADSRRLVYDADGAVWAADFVINPIGQVR